MAVVINLKIETSDNSGISIVEEVKIAPILYSESDSIKLSWKQPSDLGSNSASEITYGVKSCSISSTNCKSYGNITETSVSMRDFARDRNQIYTYHITVYGKDGSKSKEKVDLIKFSKRGNYFLIKSVLKKAKSVYHKSCNKNLCPSFFNILTNSRELSHHLLKSAEYNDNTIKKTSRHSFLT